MMLKKMLLIKLIKLLQVTKIQVTISMENLPLIYNKLDHPVKTPVLQPTHKLSIGEEMILFKRVHLFLELIKVGLPLTILTGL